MTSLPSAAPLEPDDVGETHRSTPAALLREVAVVVGGMAVLGVVCGLIWSRVAEPAQFVRFATSIGQDELALSRDFNPDGWYAAIAAAAALGSGLVFGFWRTRNLLVTLVLVLMGCAAAALLMWWTGELFGPADPAAMLQEAPIGTRAAAPLGRPEWPIFLAWPTMALAGLLVPLLSRAD